MKKNIFLSLTVLMVLLFTHIITPTAFTQSCDYSISLESEGFTLAGGTSEVSVMTPGGCSWTADDSAAAWITIDSGSSGSGDGTISYTVGPNTGADSRTGTIYLYDQDSTVVQIFTVTQMGVSEVWAKTYGGTANEYSNSIRQTSDGGYIVAGTTRSFGAGGNDIWALKLVSDGTVAWEKTYGDIADQDAQSVLQTDDGGYIIMANSSYYGGQPSLPYGPLLLKLDSDGSIDWQMMYNVNGLLSIGLTTDGGYILAGQDDYDLCVLKLTSAGSIDWQMTYEGAYSGVANSVQQTSDGGYIVAGVTRLLGVGGEYYDIWVLKLDEDGNSTWQKTYGGSNKDWANYIQQTDDDGYVVAGYTESFGTSGTDAWILRLDTDGEIEWQKTYGRTANNYFKSVQQTTDGGYIVAGYTESASTGTSWVLKLETTGSVEWQKTYGEMNGDEANSVQQTTDGGYVVAGYKKDVSGAEIGDVWVLSLDNNGNMGEDFCELIGLSTVTPVDTTVSASSTSVTPVSSVPGIDVLDYIDSNSILTEATQCSGIVCNYSISSTSQSFDSDIGTANVDVTADDGCSWTATSNATWITIDSGGSGTGDGTVDYSVLANSTSFTRTGSMTIAGEIFMVTQLWYQDDISPTATIVSLACGTFLNKVSGISGTASDDNSGVATLWLQITDGDNNYLGADDKWYSTEQWIKDIGTTSWSYNTSAVIWTGGETYNIDVVTADAAGNTSTEICSFTFSEGQAFSTLSLELSSQTILQNETIDATGKLTRLPDNGSGLSGQTIILTITGPDDETVMQIITTYNELGHYQFLDISGFTQKGAYTLQTYFTETSGLAGSSSDALAVLVGSSSGYAIIVEGKISSEEGLDSHNKTTNRIYDKLLERGFEDDNIYYFNYDTSQAGVDGAPTKSGIQNAIEGTSSWDLEGKMNGSPAPLYVIMLDHGNKDTFYIYNNGTDETIMPSELDSWLDTLEGNLDANALLERRIIIYGACYSGSFIDELSKVSTETDGGRMIITSAAVDEESYKGPLEPDDIRSGSYFLEEFFNQLGRGYSFKESFETATENTELYTRTGGSSTNSDNPYFDSSMQHPLLDDNGDGLGSNVLSDGTGDGQVAKDLYLGTGTTYNTNSANNPADITKVTETLYLDPETLSASLWATASNNGDVSSAWMEIRSPSLTLSSSNGTNQLDLELTKELMTLSGTTDNWEKQIDIFTESGMYEVFYFVRDIETLEISPMVRSTVYKDRTGNTPPTSFNLEYPDENGKVVRNGEDVGPYTSLIFRWGASTDPDGDNVTYNLLIAEDSLFSNVVYKEEEITTTATIVDEDVVLEDGDIGLSDLTTYYWKIEAVDAYGKVTESTQIWSFYTNNTNSIPGFIFGVVYDTTDSIPIEGATISTDLGSKAVSIEGGYYFLENSAGTYTVTSSYGSYSSGPISGIRVNSGETTELNIPMSSSAAGTGPVPGIKANDSEETLNINEGDQLTIAVSLDPGNYSGTSADWYVVVNTSSEWQSFDLSQMDFSISGLSALLQDYGLFSLGSTEIYSTSSLSAGIYTYYFAVDLNGQTYIDSVGVTVEEGGVLAPTGFTASASGDIITLSWNAVSGAEGYNLYYGFSSGDYLGTLDLGNTTGQSFSGIPNGTYYLAVTAYTTPEESGYSREAGVIVNVQ